MTRSPASWWGEAPFGPEPTMAKSARSWPSSIRRPRISRPTSASVRPTRRPAAIASIVRSAAAAARREEPGLVGVLDLAQVAQDRARGLEPAAGQGRLQRQHVHRPEPIREADRLPGRVARGQLPGREQVGDERRQRRRSPRRDDLGVAAGDEWRGARLLGLQVRHDERNRTLAGDDQERDALHRLADEAGQVAQVRPDADQQAGETRARRSPRGRRPAGPRNDRAGMWRVDSLIRGE